MALLAPDLKKCGIFATVATKIRCGSISVLISKYQSSKNQSYQKLILAIRFATDFTYFDGEQKMKLKSILLGSVAAMVAVSGARAADAVMVEPEPVEYVRICDAYGSGFFYIPGTETCLRISGYARVEYGASHIHDGYTQTKEVKTNRLNPPGFGPRNELYTKIVEVTDQQRHYLKYRGRLNFDVRNETEWGTLRSQIRLQGDGGTNNSDSDGFSSSGTPGDANVGLDRVLISLAGFQLGYSDDYWTTVGGYGYYEAAFDGQYGYSQGIFLDYTYAADGFTATLGVVDNRRSGTAGQPDFYVGSTYSGSWGRVFGTYHYDSNQSAGAWKAGAELSLADYIPGGSIKGWYMADDGDTNYVKGHIWGVTAKMDLSDNIVLFAGYSDYDCTTSSCERRKRKPSKIPQLHPDTSATQWTAGARWNMAEGLYLQVEYAKTNYDRQFDGNFCKGRKACKISKRLPGTLSRLSTGTVNVRVVRSF